MRSSRAAAVLAGVLLEPPCGGAAPVSPRARTPLSPSRSPATSPSTISSPGPRRLSRSPCIGAGRLQGPSRPQGREVKVRVLLNSSAEAGGGTKANQAAYDDLSANGVSVKWAWSSYVGTRRALFVTAMLPQS